MTSWEVTETGVSGATLQWIERPSDVPVTVANLPESGR